MAPNFPASPTLGQLYQYTSGAPVYCWDGSAWSQHGSVSALYPDGSKPMQSQLTLAPPPVATNDAASKSYSDGFLHYDAAQSPSSTQDDQARRNMAAAPPDSSMYTGLQINGGMSVAQGGSGVFTPTTTQSYLYVDMWYMSGYPYTCNAQQITDAPPGYTNSLKISITGGYSGTNFLQLVHVIEGLRVAKTLFGTANAFPLTLSFWVKAYRTGIYTAYIQNTYGDRSYLMPCTVNNSGVWELKSFIIPGETSGRWTATNGASLRLTFQIYTSASPSPPYIWTQSNVSCVTGQINGAQTTSDYFQITGVLLLPGAYQITAQNAAWFQRSYEQELMLCKRYFYNGVPPINGVVDGSGNMNMLYYGAGVSHQYPMRATPTVNMPVGLPVHDGQYTAVCNSLTGAGGTDMFLLQGLVWPMATPTLQGGRPCIVYQGAGGNMTVDCRMT